MVFEVNIHWNILPTVATRLNSGQLSVLSITLSRDIKYRHWIQGSDQVSPLKFCSYRHIKTFRQSGLFSSIKSWVAYAPYWLITGWQVKRCTPEQVLPVLNVYTNSFVVCSCIIWMCTPWCTHWVSNCRQNACTCIYAWANNKTIGVCIEFEGRKYLY